MTDASLRNANLDVSSSNGVVMRNADVTGASGVDSLKGADLTGAKGRTDTAGTILRFLLAAGIGLLVIGVVLAIVRRSRGLARDT
jgi:uncharacterized protein YjbI with pentapeptide repeats